MLKRSDDHIFGGVCGGIAEFFGWSPGKVRLLYVLVSIFSAAFPGILTYIVLWIVMPGPDAHPPFRMEDPGR
ncbi:MAG: PspC domain-containing protein [Candidatus Eisenbacteria bacterium]|nr:PspC domain-containing protein [Candidatus Eisenbacteria bacterium]